ncbi:LysR family transcriptional regulator [Sulfitobacter aestuariivivens]|uniref:LysR family transcriptional regulator n=1 Tax=Sulfitobacter aestuariivivens TaxID=2766981 RepID=A0A927D3L9_9RHOB|nr:LysR family transcriptional regulator [Sulfitobacter aestuariivivens]MBD3662732.1 LysR family transcriptional regulator [Sulfitobacter aestuariivivens]
MSISLPPLDHIPAFHSVMTHGSLSGAARVLGLAQPTVRRHIEAMESNLETALFTRAANGLTPTAMAHTLMPIAEAVLEEARALGRVATAHRDALEGVVRVTSSRVVATHVLPPVLAALRQSAPAITTEIAATDRPENLARRAADIAIRFTPPTQQALVAQKLPDVALGLFAVPGLADIDGLAALRDAPLILDDREGRIGPALAAIGVPSPQNVVLRCDDALAQIGAICAGVGIGVCQVRLADRLGLRRVLPVFEHRMPAWIVVHEDQAQIARIRHVFDLLKARLPRQM